MNEIIFSPIPVKDLEPMFKNWVRDVLNESGTKTIKPEYAEDITLDDCVEIAKESGIPIKKSNLYKYTFLAGNGQSDFPFKKFGRRVVVNKAQFIAWLQKHTVTRNIIETAEMNLKNIVERRNR